MFSLINSILLINTTLIYFFNHNFNQDKMVKIMPIPKFDELFNDVLEFLSDEKEYKTRDVKEELSNKLDLTDEERHELLPSGQEPIIKRKTHNSIVA